MATIWYCRRTHQQIPSGPISPTVTICPICHGEAVAVFVPEAPK